LTSAAYKLELDYEQASQGAPESAARVRAAVAKFLDGYAAFNQNPRLGRVLYGDRSHVVCGDRYRLQR